MIAFPLKAPPDILRCPASWPPSLLRTGRNKLHPAPSLASSIPGRFHGMTPGRKTPLRSVLCKDRHTLEPPSASSSLKLRSHPASHSDNPPNKKAQGIPRYLGLRSSRPLASLPAHHENAALSPLNSPAPANSSALFSRLRSRSSSRHFILDTYSQYHLDGALSTPSFTL